MGSFRQSNTSNLNSCYHIRHFVEVFLNNEILKINAAVRKEKPQHALANAVEINEDNKTSNLRSFFKLHWQSNLCKMLCHVMCSANEISRI